MQYKNFKDIRLSALGMGNMRLPTGEDGKIDFDRAREIIDLAMKEGINYYDTAYVYHGGESEKFLGKELVGRYPRDSFYLASKFLIFVTDDYKAVFEEQLERLCTDCIDFYLIHGINDDIWGKYLNCGCVEYFLEQREKGRIKYLGFSSHASPECLEKFASAREWDFAQIQMNYFDWQFGSARREYEVLEKLGIPVMVMEPCRGGRLAALTPEAEKPLREAHPDWSIPEWAFRWVKSHPQVQVVLSGMSNTEQLTGNLATFSDSEGLSDTDMKLITEACGNFRSQIVVPCTACRYCCEACPQKINIPEYLSVYNNYKLNGEWALGGLKDIKSDGKPADCIACGACRDICPQGIDVPALMEKLTELKKE